MKKHITLLLCLLAINYTMAQLEDIENKITLSVVLPDNSENLQHTHISKIASKIQMMVSYYGISGEGYTNNFVIYPKYEIYNKSIVEGMKNVYVIDAEFNLFIKEVKTGKIYSSYSQKLKGDGYSYAQAIDKSISKINTQGEAIDIFINEGKTKIINYYIANCDRIYSDGTSLIKQQRFREAIALLYSVPKEVGECYEKIRDKTDEAYMAYQNQICKEKIQSAKALIAGKNYNSAINILMQTDPSSSCANETERLISQIRKEIDEKEREQLALQEKLRKDAMNMELIRMQNQKEIAIAYYKSKPQTIVYKSLF